MVYQRVITKAWSACISTHAPATQDNFKESELIENKQKKPLILSLLEKAAAQTLPSFLQSTLLSAVTLSTPPLCHFPIPNTNTWSGLHDQWGRSGTAIFSYQHASHHHHAGFDIPTHHHHYRSLIWKTNTRRATLRH